MPKRAGATSSSPSSGSTSSSAHRGGERGRAAPPSPSSYTKGCRAGYTAREEGDLKLPSLIELREYRELLRDSGAYADIELDILDEALSAWGGRLGESGLLVELRDGKLLAGLAVASREAATDFTFDVRALCLGPAYRGTRATASLLALLEAEALGRLASAIIRVETSSAKAEAFGEGSLELAGYFLLGHIPDFYARGNDYFMYAKHLRRESA